MDDSSEDAVGLLISNVRAVTMTRKTECGTRETNERNNKSFVRTAVFACLVFSLALAAVSLGYDRTSAVRRQSNPAKKQPNIIWLVLDDAGPTLGCYGELQEIKTNIVRHDRQDSWYTSDITNTH